MSVEMSAGRPVSAQPAAKGGAEPWESRRPAGAFTLAIYLAAFAVPGLGSTLAWAWGYTSTRDPALAVHYRRALTIQIPCVIAMVAVQAGVVAALWLGFPGAGPAALRNALLVVGLHATAGLYLLMGLVGPILLVAERRVVNPPPVEPRRTPPPLRTPPPPRTPSPRSVSTRKVRSG